MPSLPSVSPASVRFAPYPSPYKITPKSTTGLSTPTSATPLSSSFKYRPRRNGRILSNRREDSLNEEINRDLRWEIEHENIEPRRESRRVSRVDRRKSHLFVGRGQASNNGLADVRGTEELEVLEIPSSDAPGLHLGIVPSPVVWPLSQGSRIDGLPVTMSSSAMSVNINADIESKGGMDVDLGRATPSSPLGEKYASLSAATAKQMAVDAHEHVEGDNDVRMCGVNMERRVGLDQFNLRDQSQVQTLAMRPNEECSDTQISTQVNALGSFAQRALFTLESALEDLRRIERDVRTVFEGVANLDKGTETVSEPEVSRNPAQTVVGKKRQSQILSNSTNSNSGTNVKKARTSTNGPGINASSTTAAASVRKTSALNTSRRVSQPLPTQSHVPVTAARRTSLATAPARETGTKAPRTKSQKQDATEKWTRTLRMRLSKGIHGAERGGPVGANGVKRGRR